MSDLFLIRNLLSIKSAHAIINDYGSENPIFSVVQGNHSLRDILENKIKSEGNIRIISTKKVNLYNISISSLLKQKKSIKVLRGEVEKSLLSLGVKRLFITYPMHLDSYLYYKSAKKLGIKVNFYEEGPCFYREGRTRQYSINNAKDLIRKIYFRIVGVDWGYNFIPDDWFCSLPIMHSYKKINIKYEKCEIDGINSCVFLSRPVSDDYPGVSINDEVKAIKSFVLNFKNISSLSIKFHPRESERKRIDLIKLLSHQGIKVYCLSDDYSSEDVLYSMDGGVVCGYDTTTLVYANHINPSVDVYSVLGLIKTKDITGFLSECYEEYIDMYKHIKMIK